MVAEACKIHRQLANVKPASDGVLLISASVCLCESICIPCWQRQKVILEASCRAVWQAFIPSRTDKALETKAWKITTVQNKGTFLFLRTNRWLSQKTDVSPELTSGRTEQTHFNPFRSQSVCNSKQVIAQSTFASLCVYPYYSQSVRFHAALRQTLAITRC